MKMSYSITLLIVFFFKMNLLQPIVHFPLTLGSELFNLNIFSNTSLFCYSCQSLNILLSTCANLWLGHISIIWLFAYLITQIFFVKQYISQNAKLITTRVMKLVDMRGLKLRP